MAWSMPGHATVRIQGETSSATCDGTFGGTSTGATQCSLPLESAAHIDLLPAVQLVAQAGGSHTDVSDATAELNYYFEFVGPAGPNIPFVFHTNMLTSNFDLGGAYAHIRVNSDPGDLASPDFNLSLTACSNPSSQVVFQCSGDPVSLGGTFSLFATPNQAANIDMTVQVAAIGDGTGFASADPMITIDPLFPNASDYTLIISDGVGNDLPSSVPEPSEWTLLLLALAGLAFRRLQHSPVTA
jgi:hypothetical protein